MRNAETSEGEAPRKCATELSGDSAAWSAPAACSSLPGCGYGTSGSADIRRGEASSDYHADETYRSSSRVRTLLDSPLLYHQRYIARTLPPFSSSATDHGTLMHRWLEEGDSFLDSLVAPPPDTLTATGLVGKEAQNWAKNEAPAGATVVSPKERAQLLAEVAAIKAHPGAMELLDRVTEREISIRWETPDGHKLKCRFDALTSDGLALDLKTTKDTDILREWHGSVMRFAYHLQCAWYMRGMEAFGIAPAPLRFIVISTSLPHDCQVVTLPDAVIAAGQRLMDRALADLRVREDLDWWLPDSHGEVVELQFPAHVLRSLT